MFTQFSNDEFAIKRREKLLSHMQYSSNFKLSEYAFEVVTRTLAAPHRDATAHNLVESSSQRAFFASTHLANCYSGGHAINDLRSFFPSALRYWEEYAHYQKLFHATDEYSGDDVAHVALVGSKFYRANGLLCFAILLGFSNLVPRIFPLIDYNNPEKDGMLERMIELIAPGRGTPPDKCTRHLPYFKTLKIFKSASEKRPELMAAYLEDWYHASRREPYHDSEKQSFFTGYWSYEAAAITFLLEIDDSSYSSAPFYPKELVDFARMTRANYEPEGTEPIKNNELRVRAGELCPTAGKWLSLDSHAQIKRYNKGETMVDLGSPYGFTVWQYIDIHQ
jgi:hypothetical protein